MNFQTDVINRSETIPVLVDFWAPWCGPCKYLGPILDELAEEQKEKWALVKVNVDEHTELSNQFGIRGIPAVKLFHRGDVIAEFGGAMPKNSIKNWLNKYLPSASKDQAADIISESSVFPDKDLVSRLIPILNNHPELTEERVHLARHLSFLDPEKALQWVENFHLGDPYYDDAQNVRNFVRFMQHKVILDEPVEKAIQLAQSACAQGDLEQAIQQIIEANRLDKDYQNDLPRLAAIAFFDALGRNHPITKKYRKQFDMVLY